LRNSGTSEWERMAACVDATDARPLRSWSCATPTAAEVGRRVRRKSTESPRGRPQQRNAAPRGGATAAAATTALSPHTDDAREAASRWAARRRLGATLATAGANENAGSAETDGRADRRIGGFWLRLCTYERGDGCVRGDVCVCVHERML